MNKNFFAGLVLGTSLLMPNAAGLFAAQALRSLPVTLTVKEHFDLDLKDCSLDFGDVRQGETAREKFVRFSASSNHGAGWSIQIQSDPLRKEGDGKTIPQQNFSYAVQQSPSGNAPSRGAFSPVPSSMTTIYSADKEHATVTDAEFNLAFKVDVPREQQTGRYSTTLYIRLADNM